jgi:hypothetical protein
LEYPPLANLWSNLLREHGISNEDRVAVLFHARQELAKKDLFYLIKYVLGYSELTTHFHQPLCNSLTYYRDEPQLHLHPRGHFKSTIITIGESIQDIVNNPNIRILLVNAVLGNSESFVQELKSHFIHNERFKTLFPEHQVLKAKDWGNQSRFTTPARTDYWIREASVEAAGIDKNIVSRHYDKIVFDDVVNKLNVATKEFREKILSAYREYLSLLDPPGLVRMVGTRWHYHDLYGTILDELRDALRDEDEPDYKIFLTRAIKHVVPISETWEPVFPERFSETYLKKLRKKQKSHIFYSQYLNDPKPPEEKIFDKNNLRFSSGIFTPEGSHLFKVLTCDPSVSEKSIDDPSVLLLTAINCDGDIFISRLIREWYNPEQLIDAFLKLLKDERPNVSGIEANAFQKVLKFFLEKEKVNRQIYAQIQEIKRPTNIHKIDRIKRISPFLAERRIFVVDDPEHKSENTTQIEVEFDEFPFSRYDDCLDALADAIELMKVPSRPKPRKVVYEYRDKSTPYGTGKRYNIKDIDLLKKFHNQQNRMEGFRYPFFKRYLAEELLLGVPYNFLLHENEGYLRVEPRLDHYLWVTHFILKKSLSGPQKFSRSMKLMEFMFRFFDASIWSGGRATISASNTIMLIFLDRIRRKGYNCQLELNEETQYFSVQYDAKII